MTKVSKIVDKAIYSGKRSQVFTQADLSGDDIALVETSLGRPAKKVFIDDVAGGSLVIQLNVVRTVYPPRRTEGLSHWGADVNIAQGEEFTDNSMGTITISEDETFSHEGIISDIKIVSTTTATAFSINVS